LKTKITSEFDNNNNAVAIIRFCQLRMVGWLKNIFRPVSSSGALSLAPATPARAALTTFYR